MQLPVRTGINTFRIRFQHLCLLPGRYFLAIGIIGNRGYEDAIDEAVDFEIISTPEAAEINADGFDGAFVPSATVSILNYAAEPSRHSFAQSGTTS